MIVCALAFANRVAFPVGACCEGVPEMLTRPDFTPKFVILGAGFEYRRRPGWQPMKVRTWRLVGILVATIALVACSSGSKPAAGSNVVLPGPTQGYLSVTGSAVVFVQLARQGSAVSGTETWAKATGSVPSEQVTLGDATVTGSLTSSGVTLSFNGSAKQFGALGSASLHVEVPQSDGTLADITFSVASVDDYNRALAGLRSTVAAANVAATSPSAVSAPPGSVAPLTTAPPASQTIAVRACPTTYGTAQTGPPPALAPIAVDLPADVAARLGFYTTETYDVPPVLAPRGWNCSALVAGDGSIGVTVYPPGGTAPQIGVVGKPSVVAQSDSACQSCVWGSVCRFVPAAGRQLGYTDLTCPGAPAGEQTHWIRGAAGGVPPISDVIGFEDPGTPDATDGVVLYNNRGHGGSASEEDCTLPAAQHALCTAILNRFSAQEWLMS
jgi:hypothetical protein